MEISLEFCSSERGHGRKRCTGGKGWALLLLTATVTGHAPNPPQSAYVDGPHQPADLLVDLINASGICGARSPPA